MKVELTEKEVSALNELIVNELEFLEEEFEDWQETKLFWLELQTKLAGVK